MRIIKKYFWNVAWYAQVELDDNSRVELKAKQDGEPTDDDFLAIAAVYVEAMKPPEPIIRPVDFPISTPDGLDLHTTTIGEYITHLENDGDLSVTLGDYLVVPLGSWEKIAEVSGQQRDTIFNTTLAGFLGLLKAGTKQTPAMSNYPVTACIQLVVEV